MKVDEGCGEGEAWNRKHLVVNERELTTQGESDKVISGTKEKGYGIYGAGY